MHKPTLPRRLRQKKHLHQHLATSRYSPRKRSLLPPARNHTRRRPLCSLQQKGRPKLHQRLLAVRRQSHRPGLFGTEASQTWKTSQQMANLRNMLVRSLCSIHPRNQVQKPLSSMSKSSPQQNQACQKIQNSRSNHSNHRSHLK